MMTPKKHRFAEEYLLDLNGTKAAIRAGYSRHSAYSQASTLLMDPEVAALVARLQAERAARVQVQADFVLERLVQEAEADLAEIFDEDGVLLQNINDWPLIWRQGLVQGVDSEEIEQDGVKVGIMRTPEEFSTIEDIDAGIGVLAAGLHSLAY